MWRRYQDALTAGPGPQGVARNWDGYALWQRYWTSLLGFRLAPKYPDEEMPATAGYRQQMPALEDALLRLPRFDRAALKTAGTASLQRQSRETRAGGMRYLLRDAGRDRLEIVAESASDSAGSAVLPVTVTTREQSADYFLVFIAKEPGVWVAAVQVRGFRYWADVSVHGLRASSSLDLADANVVARSVRAAPDLWIAAWQTIAQARETRDPVREAIEKSLGS
jgi:hypothetical protein